MGSTGYYSPSMSAWKSAAPHRIPAVQALVASPAPHRDAPANITRRRVRLHVGPLLAQGVGHHRQAELGAAWGGADDVGGGGFGDGGVDLHAETLGRSAGW